MSCKRLSMRWRALPAWLAATVFSAALSSTLATAQDCPTALSGKAGFVVQRGELQKTEVFQVDDGIVRTVMRYNGTTLLETTQHQGLFELDRLDRNVRTRYEPRTDLKSCFRSSAAAPSKRNLRRKETDSAARCLSSWW